MEPSRTTPSRTPTKTESSEVDAEPARAVDACLGDETDYDPSLNEEPGYDIYEGFRCVFKIPPEDFESLERYLDSPPERNPGLENLFRQARSSPLAVATREFSG